MKSVSLVPLAAVLTFFAAACSSSPDRSGPPPRDPVNHRASRPLACDAPRGSRPPIDMSGGGCKSDADCTDGVNGRCQVAGLAYAECSYDKCTRDADCEGGSMCECRGATGSVAANTCVRAGCQTDTDCGGPWCSPSLAPGGCGGTSLSFAGYFCHNSADECVDDADCPGESAMGGASCDYDPGEGYWRCSVRSCVSD